MLLPIIKIKEPEKIIDKEMLLPIIIKLEESAKILDNDILHINKLNEIKKLIREESEILQQITEQSNNTNTTESTSTSTSTNTSINIKNNNINTIINPTEPPPTKEKLSYKNRKKLYI
jgi:hypothetical protein